MGHDHIPFRVSGLSPEPFRHLFGLSDRDLATHHARRVIADACPGYPDRIALRDAAIGEALILVNHAHLPRPGPYRSSHAVFVAEHAERRYDAVDTVPPVLRSRMLSVRAFDEAGSMTDADLVDGHAVETLLGRFLEDTATAFIHVHFAKRGCYACRVDRA